MPARESRKKSGLKAFVLADPGAQPPVREVPILPVRHTVLFPYAFLPFNIGRPRSIALLNDVMAGDRTICVVTQKDGAVEEPTPGEIHGIGTLATVLRMVRVADDRISILVQGITRVRILEVLAEEPYLKARVETLAEEEKESDVETGALEKAVVSQFEKVVAISPNVPDEAAAAARNQ